MQFLPIKFGIGFKMLYLCIVEREIEFTLWAARKFS